MSAAADRTRPSYLLELLAIGSGGAIGAAARHAIAVAMTAGDWSGVIATSTANLIGSFLLGAFVGHVESSRAHPLLRPFLTVGVFGSFTTFSALALDNRRLAGHSGEGLALAHLAGSLLLGLAAFYLGDRVDARLRGKRLRGAAG